LPAAPTLPDDRPVAYDDKLAERIRELLDPEAGVSEQRMFGGLAFLIGGNMAVAASSNGGLMVRVPPEETDQILARAHTAPMEMNGRHARGWVRVTADGVRGRRELKSWVDKGVGYARSLSAK
jgi:TfoX/Sxy family transcriptional regulator of competence genes